MMIVTSCFGDHYIPFLAVLLRSIRQTMPEQKSLVIYSDLNKNKKKLLSYQNPNALFVHSDELPRLKGTSRRIGQKMDLWLQAYQMMEDEHLAFLDCDMIVRSPIDDVDWDGSDFIFTIKNEVIPINTGAVFARKSEVTQQFLKLWRDETDRITRNCNNLKIACEKAGGADQYALLQIINLPQLSLGLHNIAIDTDSAKIRFVDCSIYNETNVVPLSGPAKILHYKGRWHRIFLKGSGVSDKMDADRENFLAMWQLWQDMLREEEEAIGCRLLPWKARYRLAKAKLMGRRA